MGGTGVGWLKPVPGESPFSITIVAEAKAADEATQTTIEASKAPESLRRSLFFIALGSSPAQPELVVEDSRFVYRQAVSDRFRKTRLRPEDYQRRIRKSNHPGSSLQRPRFESGPEDPSRLIRPHAGSGPVLPWID